MPLVATKILESDPRYEAGQDKYDISGDFVIGPVNNVRLPQVSTLEQAQAVLESVQKAKAAEIERFAKPLAAMAEVIVALQAAGAVR